VGFVETRRLVGWVHACRRSKGFPNWMDPDLLSRPESRRSSRSPMSLIVTLKVPPRALALATSSEPLSHLQPSDKVAPFPPSSPPTMASSPAPGALPKKRVMGKRKPGVQGTGSGLAVLKDELTAASGTGGGSGAGTPAPQTEKERAKPGPKANPGGINAGLRALDRTGKPTRRWERVQYPVRTCTGNIFYTTTWVSPGTITFLSIH
jgi:INO80 complex subunit Ies4